MRDKNQYQKEYYLKNKDRIKQRDINKYKENKEQILLTTSKYYSLNNLINYLND